MQTPSLHLLEDTHWLTALAHSAALSALCAAVVYASVASSFKEDRGGAAAATVCCEASSRALKMSTRSPTALHAVTHRVAHLRPLREGLASARKDRLQHRASPLPLSALIRLGVEPLVIHHADLPPVLRLRGNKQDTGYSILSSQRPARHPDVAMEQRSGSQTRLTAGWKSESFASFSVAARKRRAHC
jgi:hypothetical protein